MPSFLFDSRCFIARKSIAFTLTLSLSLSFSSIRSTPRLCRRRLSQVFCAPLLLSFLGAIDDV